MSDKNNKMNVEAQILQNYDLYGELSNPLTHLQDYPSIAAARKARLKVRKKILQMMMNSRIGEFDGKDLNKQVKYKTREDL